MNNLMDSLSGTRYFSMIDLKDIFLLYSNKKGDEWKIVFKIKYGLYKRLVLPFGLTSAASSFMRLTAKVLRSCIDNGSCLFA
jgi:hypothetical protein